MALDMSKLTGSQRDAYSAVLSLFKTYGLETLAPKILEYVQQGFSSDTITTVLQETHEYKARFAANDVRIKNGMAALSPAEYLATERQYRQIMSAAGVPTGFYDQPQDFQKFLERDISPQEVQGRVQEAQDFVNRADPQALQQMKNWYTQGDLIAYALDPTRAANLVGKSFAAAGIGAEALNQGVGDIGKNLAEQIAGRGISADQASQGLASVGLDLGNTEKLGSIYGDNITNQDLVKEALLNDSGVAQRRQKLASQERAQFGGSSAVGAGSLGRSSAGNL